MSRRLRPRARRALLAAAVTIALMAALAAAFFSDAAARRPADGRKLVLENVSDGAVCAEWPVRDGDWFSVGFVHSVNKSPVTDYYEIRPDGIYVVQTVYYNFGAGVQTELGEGQVLTYGEDGSMIVSGFDMRMDDLTYFVGTVSDHVLEIGTGDVGSAGGLRERVSLRDLCGRSAHVRFVCR